MLVTRRFKNRQLMRAEIGWAHLEAKQELEEEGIQHQELVRLKDQ